MSQLVSLLTANATVVPSGDSVGDVSMPAASVMRVKVDQCWPVGGAGRVAQATTATAIAPAATAHGTHDERDRARGGSTAATAAAGELPDVADDRVSSAKAKIRRRLEAQLRRLLEAATNDALERRRNQSDDRSPA